MDIGATIGILSALFVLLGFSAFFSAAETAFTGFSRARMKSLAAHDKGAAKALEMSENFGDVLTALLVGNNIVNILATSLATILFTANLGNFGVTVSTFVMTALVLIFGEVTPKTLAKERQEEFAAFSCRILAFFGVLFKPLCFVFDLWKKLLTKIFRLGERPVMTEEEFRIIVDDITNEGVLQEDENAIIRNAMKYGELTVSVSMIPAEHITYVDICESMQGITRVFSGTNYSRVPVVRGGLDKVAGILYRSDFYRLRLTGGEDIRPLIKPAFYCKPSDKLPDALAAMQKNRQHLSLVADGARIVGLITVEDIVEELVGEIEDRYDRVPNDGRLDSAR